MSAVRIPGTVRQSLTSASGTQLQRQYMYLPVSVWHALQLQARESGTSVSQVIEHLAISGLVKSKDQNANSIPRSN